MKKISFLILFFIFQSACSVSQRIEESDNSIINPTTPILQIESGGHTTAIVDMFFTNDGKQLVTASRDKTVRVWDVSNGKLLRTLRGQIGDGEPGMIFAAALSSDNRWLAISGWMSMVSGMQGVSNKTGQIRLFDFQSGEIVRLLGQTEGASFGTQALAFSPDNTTLVSSYGGGKLVLWNVLTGQSRELGQHFNDIHSVSFSPNGQQVVVGNDNYAAVMDIFSGKVIQNLIIDNPVSENDNAVVFTPDGRYILSNADWSYNKIVLWDANSGKSIKVLASSNSKIRRLIISSDSSLVLAINGKHCDVYAIPSGKLVKRFSKHDNTIFSAVFAPTGTLVASAGGNRNTIYIWDALTGEVKQRIQSAGSKIVNIGLSGHLLGWGKDITHIAPKGSAFAINKNTDGSAFARSELTHQYDLKTRTIQPIDADFSWRRGLKSTAQASIISGDDGYSLDLKNGKKWTASEKGALSLTLSPDSSSIIEGGSYPHISAISTNDGEFQKEYIGHKGAIWSLATSEDGRLLVSGSQDQTMRIWDLDSRKNLLTIFHGDDDEWAAWTPEGFFDASPNGDKYIGWHVNQGEDKAAKFFSATQFRRYLYRPDIVINTLDLLSSGKAIQQAGMSDFTLGDLIERAPSNITISNIKPLNNRQLEVSILLSINQTNIPERITIFVNGSQQLSEKERVLSGINPSDALTYVVSSSDKKNIIKVLVENKWAESSAEAHFTNPNWSNDKKPKGVLYVTAIGINSYPNLPHDQQLNTPGLDAERISKIFKELEGKLYDKVEIQLLTNKTNIHITASQISKLLLKQAESTSAEDTSIIFLAGHGVTDSKNNYHFVTADTGINNLKAEKVDIINGTSFDWTLLHKALDITQGTRLVIVDTCQAGAVLSKSRIDIKKLIKDVHDVNAIIYSGTSRQQAGLETNKGGVFTNAILDGIQGQATYNNNFLQFTSLKNYVDNAVPIANNKIIQRGLKKIKKTKSEKSIMELTQTPIAVIPDDMKDFVIYYQK